MYLLYIEWRTPYFSPTVQSSGTFVNGKYEKLSYPKNQKICNSGILVTLLKMQQIFM